VIERIAEESDDDDFDFRYYLKAKCRMSDKQLDSTVRNITDQVWQKIDCTTCANCCKTLGIVVTPADIKLLSKRLNMTVADFSAAYVDKGSEGNNILKSEPCVFLGADNRCTVYEDRPAVCREYPYLYEDNFRSRTLNIIANTSLCPIVFNVWHRLKQTLR
jgi:Fe-S-cluster containining protein